ncbi:MAG TPA: anthranilate synthase component I family protein [Solirubrobacteraceae bacterium]|nr:anthranilate synthase component I family protein [Solirubrobacteraceae bacterium]
MLVTSAGAAGPTGASEAELWRVRLPWACGPELVLAALAGEPYLCCLSGVWAGGGTIIAADPVRLASPEADPFALLDDLPTVTGDAAQARGAVGGGWFGWLGYRLSARIEDVPLREERAGALPEFHLAYYDHVLHQDAYGYWWFEALARPERSAELEERLERLRRCVAEQRFAGVPADRPGPSPLRLAAGVAAHHLEAVAACRERIAAGEIFQANICQRLDGAYGGTTTELLRSALIGGRVPQYTAAFETPAGGVLSLSPELFLRRQGRHVRSGPIKGTVHRPSDPERAVLSLQQLQASAKDAAEHVMIVDLMRNDLGRVCDYGTVTAPRRPTAEAHPGLWHLVTHVEGRLRREVGNAQLLRAAFPPGSVTGAPKVQALKVIAALEPCGREVYTGAIGYASPLAGLELNVAIRTLELAAGHLWLGVGGGIVADSDPRAELEETLVKARPVAAAIGTTVISE